jgi:two-component system, cell cycle sensor histidine kinase and response regulator CckA
LHPPLRRSGSLGYNAPEFRTRQTWSRVPPAVNEPAAIGVKGRFPRMLGPTGGDHTVDARARRPALDGLVAHAARRMVDASEDDIDRVTLESLGELGSILDADIVSLVRHVPRARLYMLEVTHRWFSPRNGPPPWPLEYPDWQLHYPWLYSRLVDEGPYFAASMADLPEEAVRERELGTAGGLVAGLWAPHVVDGRLEGMITAFWRLAKPTVTAHDLGSIPIVTDVLLAALRRRDVDRSRRLTESRQATLWHSDAVGLADWRHGGLLVRANASMCRLLGVTAEQIHEGDINFTDLTPPEYADHQVVAQRELDQTGNFRASDKEIIRGDGTRLWIAVGGGSYAPEVARSVGADGYLFAIDISERKRLEAQLQQAQKMDAIGQLAGGIAHDFNNLLTVITTSAELAVDGLPSDARAIEDLQEIVRTADRAAQLTRQLLAFGRRQYRELRVMDINDVLRDMERLLRRVIGADVSLVSDLFPELGHVRADEGQLQQVILNLAVNARDAMPDGGTLTLRTSMMTVRGDEAEHVGVLEAGNHVRVTVADTGHGMDAATMVRAFEPFFSTKPIGRGTGLGLAVVYGIVRQSGGNVWIARTDTGGTRIDVCLPVVDAPTEARPPRGAAPRTADGQTVLLVEDDDGVRALTQRLLGQLGYRVITARDGGEALARWRESSKQVELLLSDVVMPGMSGHELAEMLRGERPDLPIVLMSGYSRDRLSRSLVEDQRLRRLDKPFTASELAERLADVLAAE